MGDIKLGDEVRVFDVNGRRMGQPEGGWPGTVVRVGRKLADIKYGGRVDTFRIDDRQANDKYGHQSFQTLKEAALDARRDAALKTLRDRRVSLGHGNTFTVEQIEKLADLVRTFEKEA
jgi:hypothetical protein